MNPRVSQSTVNQTTLARPVSCRGIGLHGGESVAMTLKPAAAGTGIVFERSDLSNGARRFPARFDMVSESPLCTVLGNGSGATLSTVEHIMAALSGCGIDNVLIEVRGGEVPIMDGSAAAFVALIDRAGLAPQPAPRRQLRVLREVAVAADGGSARLLPCSERRFRCEIAYDDPQIGSQSAQVELAAGAFRADIARARTFGLMKEVAGLRARGLALGGSLDNAVVVADGAVLNRDGLRYDNEFARHKLLDAIGDLALAGAPILGAFEGYRSGHALNHRLLQALFEDGSAWRWEEGAG